MVRNESDTAWKEMLDAYFKDCIDYCLPKLSELINWKKPCVSLDKELQAITHGVIGKRLFDKGFSKKEVGNLYKFIDWLIGLPRPL